jgi:4-amino-4-deoxy-L-arabinose transferase-like glycosyltransferase
MDDAKKQVDLESRPDWRPWLLVIALGCVLFIPLLGSHGLWDPWETHYAEVAREMVASGNWLEPTWERNPEDKADGKYFFSKPVLTFWMMAVPMKIFGIHGDAGITPGAEWYLRFPFVLTAILGLLATFALARRFFGLKVGLLAALILGTCPQYYFIARQAMTDMPLTGFLSAGLALLIIGGFDREKPRTKLILAGYAMFGLAVLTKGLIGFLFPGLIFFLYFLLSRDWARLSHMRVFSGGLLALVIAAPWFVYLSIASACRNLLDDEGKTFFTRFFLHDHIYRLGAGVHGDRGTFAYFIKQLGLGTHPWFSFMFWGGLRTAQRLKLTQLDRQQRVELLIFTWALAGFGLFSFSVTKFHHYILPTLPALAILAARWLILWLEKKENPGQILVPLVLILGVALISRDIGLLPKNLVDLFVYKYSREFPQDAAFIGQIGFAIIFGLVSLGLTVSLILYREKLARLTVIILICGALLGSLWGSLYFFQAMGPHWSQRHLFDTYFALRQEHEPIGAYLMNWRGETFYSRNQVSQLKNKTKLNKWLNKNKGKRKFLLVEQYRLKKLKKALGSSLGDDIRILDRSCNKFYLVVIDQGRS